MAANTECHYSLSRDGEGPRIFPWRLTAPQQDEVLSPDTRGYLVVLRTLGRKGTTAGAQPLRACTQFPVKQVSCLR